MKTLEELRAEICNNEDREELNETSMGRVWQHVNNPDIPIGMMTAFRNERDRKTNLKLNNELFTAFRRAGFGIVIMDGLYP